jgi:hypothetical protein
MENNVNNITNELILKYDNKFNELYDKKLDIDQSIMNKEELIVRINDEINNKSYTISVLQYSLLFSILLGVAIILYGLKKIQSSNLILIFIILLLIYLLTIYFGVYHKIYLHNLGKGLRSVKVKMDEYKADLLGMVTDYTCPSSCPPIVAPEDSDIISSYNSVTLKTNPQLDVWKYGDIPTDLWTSNKLKGSNFYENVTIPNYNETLEEQIYNAPKPFFGTTYPNSTFYKCKWLGGDNNNGLPNLDNKKYSSIPCSYRPNYSEEERYICSKDPNKINESDFTKYCDRV